MIKNALTSAKNKSPEENEAWLKDRVKVVFNNYKSGNLKNIQRPGTPSSVSSGELESQKDVNKGMNFCPDDNGARSTHTILVNDITNDNADV